MVGLQLFLSSRLRTQPFAVASRAHPSLSVPSMVPNTQYLLDGIVWALHDHPTWAAEAWLCAHNFIRDAAERFEETVAQLDTAVAVRQRQKDPHRAPRPATGNSSVSSCSSKVAREQTYVAHAAVQDVYLAFCVMDAMLKGSCAAGAAAGAGPGKHRSAFRPLKEEIEKALPHLVSDHFPIFAAFSPDNAFVADAVEEYRMLFLGLLESWAALRILESHTVRRLEEHLRYKLKNLREGIGAGEEGAPGNEGGRDGVRAGTGASGGGHSTRLAVQQSLEVLLRGTLRGTASASPGSAGRPRAPRTAEMAERNVKSFLASIFPARRPGAGAGAGAGVGARIRCAHCGAPFKDEKAKDAHYRYHFHNHNVLREEDKVVRLSYPSQDDFMAHMGDVDQSGYYPRTTELLEEAYKNGAKGTVKVRRLEDGLLTTKARGL